MKPAFNDLVVLGAVILPILAALVPAHASAPRTLRKEVVVDAPLESVWRAWTTAEGLRFISQESNVELRVGGPYEWFLELEPDEQGRRGGQGSKVLAFLHGEMLAFDWTFPPSVPALRLSGKKTQVVLLFEDLALRQAAGAAVGPEARGVRVRFAQHGWGEGQDWDAGYAYFDRAWGLVLERLKSSLESGTGKQRPD